jgi:WhiB family redox-sensing transcriptional regulator
VRTVAVLFSELLVPGWAQGGMIGLGKVTGDLSLPCHTAEPELFFDDAPARVALAKSLCGGCPMRVACLEGAFSRLEPCGVWGGHLFVDGQIVAAKRSVGRPRLEQPLQRSAQVNDEAIAS